MATETSLHNGPALERHPEGKHLHEIITKDEPLGPPFTEAFIDTSRDVFRQLYDETNRIHLTTRTESPSYIVGRKGSGKTAFLIGGALVEDRDVVLVQSQHIYTEVDRLKANYTSTFGTLVADSLVHVWEVLLYHAALWGVARSERLPNSQAKQRVWSYMSAFGDPFELEVDDLLARVAVEMTDALLGPGKRLSFREACWSIDPGRGPFREATEHAREVLKAAGPNALYVVVDNLEDMHKHLDGLADVVSALLRLTSKDVIAPAERRMPFSCRFAFPAELLQDLRVLTANPEKDFLDIVIVRWTAAELIGIAGNRLRTFLDIHFPRAPHQLGLPRRHDPADRTAAAATLRALLPQELRNGYGGIEDPVAYVLRHTQLLPRHLIQILNEIFRLTVAGMPAHETPRARPADVLRGLRKAEDRIVEGILSTYWHRYRTYGDALTAIKNHARPVESVSEFHRIFNHAGVARAGMGFEEFLDASLAVGALGVVIEDDPDDRYVTGEFDYTFATSLRAVEDRDHLCVHPLFMYRFFDMRAIDAMKPDTRPVYPYGSNPEHDRHEI
jgi:hypothetical protein